MRNLSPPSEYNARRDLLFSILLLMWRELIRCNFCEADGRLTRSESSPVSRDGLPKSSRNDVVILPSGNATALSPAGNFVYGSGVVLS